MITPIRGRKLALDMSSVYNVPEIRNDNPDKGTETQQHLSYPFLLSPD